MMATTFFIVEDHPLFSSGIINALQSLDEFNYIGSAVTGASAIEFLSKNHPDIILLDLQLPDINGIEVLDFVKRKPIPSKVIIISMNYSPTFVKLAIKQGADAFLPKSISLEELLTEIQQIQSNTKHKRLSTISFLDEGLSQRELEIAQMVASGKNSRQIAETLFISIETVRSHRKNMLKKMECDTFGQLLAKLKI